MTIRPATFAFVLVVVVALASTATLASEARIKNAWSGFEPGDWVIFDWSEQWGTNPAMAETRRTVLLDHRANGASGTATQRQEGGTWKRFMGSLEGAFPPDGEGMTLVSEAPDAITVGAGPLSCMRRQYEHDEADGSGQRLLLWHCDGVELAARVIPQWSVSFGWQIAPDVARALIERRDKTGAVMSVELELDAASESLDVEGGSVDCFREKLRWRQGMSGDQQGRVTSETTRWLSAKVPGLVVQRVDDNKIGKVTRTRVRSFGKNAQ